MRTKYGPVWFFRAKGNTPDDALKVLQRQCKVRGLREPQKLPGQDETRYILGEFVVETRCFAWVSSQECVYCPVFWDVDEKGRAVALMHVPRNYLVCFRDQVPAFIEQAEETGHELAARPLLE